MYHQAPLCTLGELGTQTVKARFLKLYCIQVHTNIRLSDKSNAGPRRTTRGAYLLRLDGDSPNRPPPSYVVGVHQQPHSCPKTSTTMSGASGSITHDEDRYKLPEWVLDIPVTRGPPSDFLRPPPWLVEHPAVRGKGITELPLTETPVRASVVFRPASSFIRLFVLARGFQYESHSEQPCVGYKDHPAWLAGSGDIQSSPQERSLFA